MFATGVVLYHYLVSLGVGMRNAGLVLAFVVLKDKPLLAFLDILPVSLKGYIEEGIASKDQLGGCGVCSGVYE